LREVANFNFISEKGTSKMLNGIDMLPVLNKNGNPVFSIGITKRKKILLPVFTLPAIEECKIRPISCNEQLQKTTSKRLLFSTQNLTAVTFVRYRTIGEFMEALLSANLTRRERKILRSHLQINEEDVMKIISYLKSLYNPKTKNLVQKSVTVFEHSKVVLVDQSRNRIIDHLTAGSDFGSTKALQSTEINSSSYDRRVYTAYAPTNKTKSLLHSASAPNMKYNPQNTNFDIPIVDWNFIKNETTSRGNNPLENLFDSRPSTTVSRPASMYRTGTALQSPYLSGITGLKTKSVSGTSTGSREKGLPKISSKLESNSSFNADTTIYPSLLNHLILQQKEQTKVVRDSIKSRNRPRTRDALEDHISSKLSSSTLKLELLGSLQSMEVHTSRVKNDILSIRQLVGSAQEKNKKFILTVSIERIFASLGRAINRQMKRGFNAWSLAVQIDRAHDKVGSFVRFMGIRHVCLGLNDLVHHILRSNFNIWAKNANAEKIRLRREKEIRAATLVQRIFRGFLARQRAASEREVHKYQQLYNSTVLIQAIIRSKVVRWRYLATIRAIKESRAAIMLQRLYRGHLARVVARQLRHIRDKYRSIIRLQSLFRQRIAMRKAALLALEKRKVQAASKIQATVRGYLSRARNLGKLKYNAQYRAAVKIQAHMRGKIYRKYFQRRKKDLQEHRRRRIDACIKIQSTYRGYRGYLKSRILKLELDKQQAVRTAAATKICNAVRCYLSKAKRRRLEKARYDGWVAAARRFKEEWSEEAQCWYYNYEGRESRWEPPREGYTTAAGKLVLENGDIIDDPRGKVIVFSEQAAEEEQRKRNKKLCSECFERFAIKNCIQCGDKYCTKCYKSAHALGTRRDHGMTEFLHSTGKTIIYLKTLSLQISHQPVSRIVVNAKICSLSDGVLLATSLFVIIVGVKFILTAIDDSILTLKSALKGELINVFSLWMAIR
jgi:hypothetical protein